jgi:hypothetical protein
LGGICREILEGRWNVVPRLRRLGFFCDRYPGLAPWANVFRAAGAGWRMREARGGEVLSIQL